ncbi:MAG: c-type cytochrome [Verrucomicrobia bacterium]|nr:MAG: c-type cytochrome [Verrucomicrobiota bacterium]
MEGLVGDVFHAVGANTTLARDVRTAEAGNFSLSFPKLAQRFGKARLGETLSPLRRTTILSACQVIPSAAETEVRTTHPFPKRGARAEEGAKVFQTPCSACHSLAGQGGRVGPELDGIGHRGVERRCEDVLDPNRNVDRVFRYSLVTLKNGSAVTGFFRREEGALVVFVDAAGKELTVEKSESAQRTEADTSLMPEAFADLLAFLLAQSTPAK